MPLLARKIKRPAAWAKADNKVQWTTDADFPYEALEELHDAREKGLSCFEVASKSNLLLAEIAAALFLGQEKQGSLGGNAQFRFIHTDDLSKLGLTWSKKLGKTRNRQLNDRHYEITGCDGPKSLQLAKHFSKQTRIVKEKDILRAIVRGLRDKTIDADALKKEGLDLLYKHSNIRFVLPRKS